MGLGLGLGLGLALAFGVGLGLAFGVGLGLALGLGFALALGLGLGLALESRSMGAPSRGCMYSVPKALMVRKKTSRLCSAPMSAQLVGVRGEGIGV